MRNGKKSALDVLKVSISNIVKLLAGIFVAFLLPKIIGVTDYGFYKTFTLYSTYVGLFHFGFIDGIYLKYGGKDYSDLEKSTFRLFTRTLIIFELFISAVLLAFGLFFLHHELKFIFICLSAFLFFYNVTTYYQFISQITSRFKELSLRNIIQSVFIGASVIVLWLISIVNPSLTISYRPFLICYVSIQMLLTIWYVFTYRDITFGICDSFKKNAKFLLTLLILGIPLLVSNLCQTFLLSLDRQFVNVLFDTETYAVYSFAYNMVTLVTTALTAVSTVLYPNLKKARNDSDGEAIIQSLYPKLVGLVLLLVFLCLAVYFPLTWFISWFLPKYSDSLPIFRIILPSIATSSAVTLIMHNYYKIYGFERLFFIKSVIILLFAFVSNCVAFYFFKSTFSISVASVISMAMWYIVSEVFFVRKFKVEWVGNFIYIAIMTVSFYLISFIDIWWVGLILYLFVFVCVAIIFHRKNIFFIKTAIIAKKENG